jgi:predicted nucleotidyltransferase
MPEEQFAHLLPDLPQSTRLRAFASDLSADPQVAAVWLGGSFARGDADPFSDVDLRVALQAGAYEPERIPEGAASLMAAATTRLRFHFGGQATLWHMLLDDGTIYDLHVQSAEGDPPAEARLVLLCRDDAFSEKLAGGESRAPEHLPAQSDEIARALQFFWMNQQKGLKVFHRGLPLLAWQGDFLMRQELIRFHYVLATGQDCGPLNRLTIHTLTPVVQAIQQHAGDPVLALVGKPARTPEELMAAASHLRDEVSRVGRLLAEKLGFDYPAAAEETVRRSWAQFPRTDGRET